MTFILLIVQRIRPWQLSIGCIALATVLAIAISHLFWWMHIGSVPDGLSIVAGGAALVVATPMVQVFVVVVYRLVSLNDELAVTRDALAALNSELETRVSKRTRALLKARDAAERASAAKSAFLANMSHELRTPLNGIIGYAEMIMYRKTLFANAPEGKLDEYATAIHASGQHLNAMVDDLLDLSKIEFGQYDVIPGPTCVPTVLNQAIGAIMPVAAARDQRIDMRIPDIGPIVQLDSRALRQIVTNIVSNALKYSGEGDAVLVSVTLTTGRLDISVTDQGIGMARDSIAQATKPFSKFSDAHIASGQSIGLGLSIVSRLCLLMGGTLDIDSAEGKGTTVTVSLPVQAADEMPAEAFARAS